MRVLILICFVFVIGVPNEIQAKEEGRKIVPAEQVINEDYGVVGEVVEISGTVRGDVYAAGGQILIAGTVDGDLIALGGVVNISGTVAQNVRVAAGQVVVSGEIGRNATIAAMNITFTDSAQVKGGVVMGGVNVFLAAPVGKEARIAGRNFTLANAVEGDLEAAVENIRLGGKARVGGNFTYWSSQEALIDEGAIVEGATARKSPELLMGAWIRPFLGIASFFTTLVLGLLLVHFFPGYTSATVHALKTRKWRSLTSGITALLLIPIVSGLLIITIVGIPLGLLLLLVSSVILYIARIFVMLWAGHAVLEMLKTQRGQGFAFFGGLVLYSLLSLIPVVGWIISFGAVLFGLGAAAESLKETYVSKIKRS